MLSASSVMPTALPPEQAPAVPAADAGLIAPSAPAPAQLEAGLPSAPFDLWLAQAGEHPVPDAALPEVPDSGSSSAAPVALVPASPIAPASTPPPPVSAPAAPPSVAPRPQRLLPGLMAQPPELTTASSPALSGPFSPASSEALPVHGTTSAPVLEEPLDQPALAPADLLVPALWPITPPAPLAVATLAAPPLTPAPAPSEYPGGEENSEEPDASRMAPGADGHLAPFPSVPSSRLSKTYSTVNYIGTAAAPSQSADSAPVSIASRELPSAAPALLAASVAEQILASTPSPAATPSSSSGEGHADSRGAAFRLPLSPKAEIAELPANPVPNVGAFGKNHSEVTSRNVETETQGKRGMEKAKDGPAMSTTVATTAAPAAPARAVETFDPAFRLAAPAPTAPSLPVPPAAALRLVEQVTELADRVLARPTEEVRLSLDLPGDHRVEVKIALRAGKVLADFRTDSSELRGALSRAWDDFVRSPDAAGRRWAEPVFAAAGSSSFVPPPTPSSPVPVNADTTASRGDAFSGQQEAPRREGSGHEAHGSPARPLPLRATTPVPHQASLPSTLPRDERSRHLSALA
jgi:hypothetical protein